MKTQHQRENSHGLSRLHISLLRAYFPCPSPSIHHFDRYPVCCWSQRLLLTREIPSVSLTGNPRPPHLSAQPRGSGCLIKVILHLQHTVGGCFSVFWQARMGDWQKVMDLTKMRSLFTCKGCNEAPLCCRGRTSRSADVSSKTPQNPSLSVDIFP